MENSVVRPRERKRIHKKSVANIWLHLHHATVTALAKGLASVVALCNYRGSDEVDSIVSFANFVCTLNATALTTMCKYIHPTGSCVRSIFVVRIKFCIIIKCLEFPFSHLVHAALRWACACLFACFFFKPRLFVTPELFSLVQWFAGIRAEGLFALFFVRLLVSFSENLIKLFVFDLNVKNEFIRRIFLLFSFTIYLTYSTHLSLGSCGCIFSANLQLEYYTSNAKHPKYFGELQNQ